MNSRLNLQSVPIELDVNMLINYCHDTLKGIKATFSDKNCNLKKSARFAVLV